MVTEKPICVTGASGFIAAHIVKLLLEQGYKVKGTLRDLKNRDQYSYLDNLENAKENLELLEAELLTPDSYQGAIEGCEYVIHTASPYVLNVKDAQKDLVDPAVKGTLNVLKSCKKTSSVKKLVLTSSIAAITDEPDSNKIFTEKDWNRSSNLDRNPYYYSKVLAEKAAWSFVKEQKTKFDLVVINPFMVIGPSLSKGLNESNKVVLDLLSGEFPGVISINWGIVDVRDVAKAHILAIEISKTKGRYLCSNSALTVRQLVDLLKKQGFDKYKLPKINLESNLGNKLTYLFSYFQPKGVGSYLRTHVGKTMRFNNAKIIKDMDITFIPLEQTIKETVLDLIKWGHLKK